MIRRTFIAAFTSALLLVGPALAHQQKAALTEILFNPRTGNIEVVHRFILHDAEHAVRKELGIGEGLVGSPDTQMAFATYVAERFSIATPEGTPLPLTLLGAEVEGGHLWVYQETPEPDGLTAFSVRHDALRDVWPKQVNRVNVKRDGTIKTLIFSGVVRKRFAVFED